MIRTRSQTFNPGELPLVLLALAKVEPRKAYEFLGELERLFGPDYRPSPGGVYPALNALVAERLLAVDRDGRARRYRLTELGRDALQRRSRQLAAIEARTAVNLAADGALRAALDRLGETVAQCAARAGTDVDAMRKVLEEANDEIRRMTADHDEGEGADDDNP